MVLLDIILFSDKQIASLQLDLMIFGVFKIKCLDPRAFSSIARINVTESISILFLIWGFLKACSVIEGVAQSVSESEPQVKNSKELSNVLIFLFSYFTVIRLTASADMFWHAAVSSLFEGHIM